MKVIPYSAQPQRISDPVAELQTLMGASARASDSSGCVTHVRVTPAMAVLKLICSQSATTHTVRFDRVERIYISTLYGALHEVSVHQAGGGRDTFLGSGTLEDAQHIVDAVTALSAATRK